MRQAVHSADLMVMSLSTGSSDGHWRAHLPQSIHAAGYTSVHAAPFHLYARICPVEPSTVIARDDVLLFALASTIVPLSGLPV